jgi:hypothetical protein
VILYVQIRKRDRQGETALTHEVIAHATVYLDKQPAIVTTLTGDHLLKQAELLMGRNGATAQMSKSSRSVGFYGPHAPRFVRMWTDYGVEAHVTFLRFPKAV